MDFNVLYRVLGVLGLIFIILGVLLRKKKQEDLAFICGGILLCIYSIYLKDAIFIVLQIVFTCAAIYDYFKKRTHKYYVND
ncbi:MAG: hypothetical protein COT14_03395 [Candidatus Diapherotrites archaeon CG08_land_8_20_14_0_20_30_16]|nr:MAG: hypothetical protein COT14_03395 [Candidatus Diapherotrites archaeon CG08_land_8_20_14_0_20_30_16]